MNFQWHSRSSWCNKSDILTPPIQFAFGMTLSEHCSVAGFYNTVTLWTCFCYWLINSCRTSEFWMRRMAEHSRETHLFFRCKGARVQHGKTERGAEEEMWRRKGPECSFLLSLIKKFVQVCHVYCLCTTILLLMYFLDIYLKLHSSMVLR